ncbi:Flagellar M-ring protein FliF [hydrothermal vent metagenome]|uniref:Flagellar M-ring protein FliF n=1 Tax=hydrothermal vent metagenome TaxID=652676 RepID=A0A1W1BSV3_9ZZZZ
MDFKVLFSQLAVVYAKLTKQQKMIIAAAIIGIVGFLIFLVVYSAKKSENDNYKVLFDSLSSKDAAKVIAQLEKDGVPYKVGDNNTIKVPKNVVYKERITIAAQGIPKDTGVGFELFNKQEFGATSFDQNIKRLRALQGELARTITALAPVEHATVNLALPKATLFVEKQTEPTASVMVTLVEDGRLTRKQIRGIKNLVAASVPRLTVANVMLVNSDGETLGDDDELDQMDELSVVQQHYKLKEERKKQQKIIDVIAPFVGGKKKVVAQVSIEYDFSIKNSTSESYDPDNVVRSEQSSEEKREGFAPKQVGGVPGTVSNIGPVQGLNAKKTIQKYSKSTGTTNYEVGKTVSTTKSQFARVKRITAAVVVDGKYKEKMGKDGKPTGELEYIPLDKSDIDALTALASRAIGIDKARGDKITVQNLQFERESSRKLNGVDKALSFTQTYLAPFSGLFKYIFVMLLLLIIYKKVIAPFADKMLEVSKEDEEVETPSLEIEEDEEDDLVEKVQAMRKKVEEQLGMGNDFDEESLKHEVMLEKVKDMAEEAPEEIASLLEALLSEGTEVSVANKG